MAQRMNCVIMAGPANRQIQVATEDRHLMTTGERIGRAIMWVAVTVIVLAFISWVAGLYQQAHTILPAPVVTPTTPPAKRKATAKPSPMTPVARPMPAAPAADLAPAIRDGLGQVAEAVRETRQPPADQYGQPVTPQTQVNCAGRPDEARCRLWNQQ
jgi:hypothetical protein